MGKIILIVGESGVGKDTVADILLDEYGIPQVISNTTRKIRDGEQDGVEHWFLNQEDIPENPNNIFAHTVYGGYDYWVDSNDIHIMFYENDIISYIVDEAGVKFLQNKINKDKQFEYLETIPIYISSDKNIRADRGVVSSRMNRDESRIKHNVKYAHYIENNGTINELKDKIDKIIQQYED